MQLPQADQAIVPPEKIRDYLLAPSHPVGRFKARFFASLGYSVDEWERLAADLKRLAVDGEVGEGEASPYGQKFEVRGKITGPEGRSADLVSVWIVIVGAHAPKFITAFPG